MALELQHQQSQRSYPGGSAHKGYKGSSSSSRAERPREEVVEWQGATYTKITYRDGRVEYQAS